MRKDEQQTVRSLMLEKLNDAPVWDARDEIVCPKCESDRVGIHSLPNEHTMEPTFFRCHSCDHVWSDDDGGDVDE